MKILHFIYDHPANPWIGGGGSRRVVRIAEELRALGDRVRIVCGRFPGAKANSNGEPSFTFLGSDRGYAMSTLSYTLAAARMARCAAAAHDLVIEDFAPWNPLFTCRLSRPPAVIQIQNYFGREIRRRFPLIGWPFRLLEKRYPGSFRHAIVINEALNRLLNIRGEVISMGIEEAMLSEPPLDGEYVAFLGRLDLHQKGLDLLVAAARALDLPVRIAGQGPAESRLRALIGGAGNIRCVGHLEGEAKLSFVREARFVVAPSRYEGQNLVVLESGAMAKPVLVSDIEALQYAVRAGFAVSFRAGDVEDLRERMNELWSRPETRSELASAGRAYAAEFTWPRVAGQFQAYCQRVLSSDAASTN